MKPSYMILGKKLSEWLELAIADMQELALIDGIDFDMRSWVALVKKEGASEVCTVCLGGCALYKGRILTEAGNSVSVLAQSKRARLSDLKYYDIHLVDLSDFRRSSTNLLLFFNSAREGRVNHHTLQEVCCLGPDGPVAWESYVHIKEFLARRELFTTDEPTAKKDLIHGVQPTPAHLDLPEGVNRKVAYANHVKEKLQHLLTALKELGL